MALDNTLYNSLPIYQFSGFRQFYEGEHHINRICTNNVLILMLSGTLHFTENGIPISISENEYYIQKAGLLQEGTIPSELPYYYFIHFNGEFDEELYNIPIHGVFLPQEVLDLVHTFNTAHLPPTSTIFEKSILFFKILSTLNQVPNLSSNFDSQSLMQYIQDNYTNDISMEILTDYTHYSKDYIIKKFKAKYNVTPYQYILRLRTNLAKKLLLSNNMSIAEISAACGFHDVSTFHRTFYKNVGYTPIQFRKNGTQ